MSLIENQAPVAITFEDQQLLAEAVRLLEYTSLTTRLTNMIGATLGAAGSMVPQSVRKVVSKAVEIALHTALRNALRGMRNKRGPATLHTHRSLATLSGLAGGAVGIAALPVELPVSTVLILRAIADIARSEGEDMQSPEVALACMEVFALGGNSPSDDSMDSGYFTVRAVLAKSVTEAAKYLAAQGAAKDSAPVLVKLIAEIASRFGIIVTQKVAAQTVPVLGAIAGAGINYAFMSHFQGLARGHFTVRRLERLYGADIVRGEYEKLAQVWRKVKATDGKT